MRGGGNMMKQAMQMQANLKKAQEEIAAMEVVGESGGGMVKVTMSGKHEVKRVQIEPQVAAEDREMLEDLIAAAINDAVHKVDEQSQARMASVMPPGFKLPF
ncbi:MAG TPA: YbaB/EbfC family nucleoid-associated protein [Steroidobacteraceae bacterium]|jgi:DNA-binding YbaB/EbfC family protein|nr:YbaB/EbfC family nucleoid-associated protein [Steroidobacteraceae bacterium]